MNYGCMGRIVVIVMGLCALFPMAASEKDASKGLPTFFAGRFLRTIGVKWDRIPVPSSRFYDPNWTSRTDFERDESLLERERVEQQIENDRRFAEWIQSKYNCEQAEQKPPRVPHLAALNRSLIYSAFNWVLSFFSVTSNSL